MQQEVPVKDTPQDGDPNRYLVLQYAGTESGPENRLHKVVAMEESEGSASDKAKELAKDNDGVLYGVYGKIGTAQQVRKVEWKGLKP